MSAEVISDPDSIASRSWGVVHAFQDLINAVGDCNVDAEIPGLETLVGDQLDRFKLWAGNIGAFRGSQSRMSLEKRLVDSPELRDQICLDLDELKESIEEFSALCLSNGDMSDTAASSKIGEDDDDIDRTAAFRDDQLLEESMGGINFGLAELSKAEQIKKMLEFLRECITALLNLGIVVRRYTLQDRFSRSLQHSNQPVDFKNDKMHLEDKYRKLRKEDSQWLVMRLGGANAKRRQVINYGRQHQEKLQDPGHDPMMLQQAGPEAGIVAASEIHDHSSEQTFSKATSSGLPVGTASSRLPELTRIKEEADDAISMVSATTAWGSEKIYKLPSLGSLSPDGETFECPICYTLQKFRTEKGWKIHAYRDLKAYVCTVRDDSCENDLFSERDSWFEHELRNHRSIHRCKLCGAHFSTDDEIQRHVVSSHEDFGGDHLEAIIQGEKVVPSHIAAKDCPFCDDWAEFLEDRADPKGKSVEDEAEKPVLMVSTVLFKRHVASHQEQLAIFALPRSIFTDTTEKDDGLFGTNGSVANAHGSVASGSNESDLDESEDPEDSGQLPTPSHDQHTKSLDHSERYFDEPSVFFRWFCHQCQGGSCSWNTFTCEYCLQHDRCHQCHTYDIREDSVASGSNKSVDYDQVSVASRSNESDLDKSGDPEDSGQLLTSADYQHTKSKAPGWQGRFVRWFCHQCQAGDSHWNSFTCEYCLRHDRCSQCEMFDIRDNSRYYG